MAGIIIFLYVLASSLALVFLKLGTSSGAPITYINQKIAFNLGWYVVTGIILYGLSFLIYTFLVSKYDLGYIVPLVTGLVYVAVFLASYFVFKEVFTPFKIAGVFLILGGILLLNVGK